MVVCNQTGDTPMSLLNQVKDFNPANKAFSLWSEFQKFAFKGNVIDLAVGVIVGGAFGKLVDSLVKNVLMPLIGLVLPGEDGYKGWVLTIGKKEIPYGLFIGEFVQFMIVAFAVFFFIVKFLGWVARFRKEDEAPAPVETKVTKDQELLTEIRDLLKQK